METLPISRGDRSPAQESELARRGEGVGRHRRHVPRPAPAAAPARTAESAADDGHAAVPSIARGGIVSDALLEPELAAARDRRADWSNAGVPIVSLVILVVLVCVAWLM